MGDREEDLDVVRFTDDQTDKMLLGIYDKLLAPGKSAAARPIDQRIEIADDPGAILLIDDLNDNEDDEILERASQRHLAVRGGDPYHGVPPEGEGP